MILTAIGMQLHLHLVCAASGNYLFYLPIDLHCTAYVFGMLSRQVSLYRDGKTWLLSLMILRPEWM